MRRYNIFVSQQLRKLLSVLICIGDQNFSSLLSSQIESIRKITSKSIYVLGYLMH